MFTLPPSYWELAKLFDGQRSYEEIAVLHSQQDGVEYSAETVREFASDLEANGFWYKTPQEKNVLLMRQSQEERRNKLKSKSRWADLSEVAFPAFNPDRFLTWLYGRTKFIYTTWFTLLTLTGFSAAAAITIAHWSEVGRDTVEFYNFSNRTWSDVAILYLLVLCVTAIHEFAHAHACKHYGARVTSMGFALLYLTPAFYTDTTEGFVQGTRPQRLTISLAGIWSELILCSIATPIWWGTPPQTLIHDGAYFIMMLTGMMSIVLNLNPLIKLDGYYTLSEIVGIQDLKENSTAFVSAWVRKHIWRLPVEVPYVPKRRRVGFVVYATLSGVYSYFVLFVVARFAGNFVRNFSPEWGFIPEIAVALLIFRSRIRLMVNFMKFIYLDKKEQIAGWFTARRVTAMVAAAGLLLVVPLWRESVTGRFLLEPVRSSVVRARVPGRITEVNVNEGQRVIPGEKLAVLENFSLVSESDDARARLLMASDRTKAASLGYSGFGTALKEMDSLNAQVQHFSEMKNALQLVSPIAGTVVSARIEDKLGTHLSAGEELLEVADLGALRARIYVSEYDLSRIHGGAPAVLQVDGVVKRQKAQTISIASKPTEMDPRFLVGTPLKGMNAPHFYLVDLVVTNPDGALRPGQAGIARIYGRRRSLASMVWEATYDFWGRKIW